MPTSSLKGLIDPSYQVVINADIEGTPNWFEPIVYGVQEGGANPDSSAEFDKPVNLGGDQINNALQMFSDQTFRTRAFAEEAWQGSDPIQMSLTVNFMTWEDPVWDVVVPAYSMELYPLPSAGQEDGEEDWFLNAPVDEDQSISVNVGNYITFPDVLPLSVSTDFTDTYCSSPSTDGAWPIACSVDFEFQVSNAPTRFEGHLGFNFQQTLNEG